MNSNTNTPDNVYGVVITAMQFEEYAQFVWWMENSAKRCQTSTNLDMPICQLLSSTLTVII